MKLVSANLFAQPKHSQTQNPNYYPRSSKMTDEENPSANLGADQKADLNKKNVNFSIVS